MRHSCSVIKERECREELCEKAFCCDDINRWLFSFLSLRERLRHGSFFSLTVEVPPRRLVAPFAKQGKRRANKPRERVLGCNMVYGLCSGIVVLFELLFLFL